MTEHGMQGKEYTLKLSMKSETRVLLLQI